MILVIQLESFTTHFRSGKTFSIQISKCPTRHKKKPMKLWQTYSHTDISISYWSSYSSYNLLGYTRPHDNMYYILFQRFDLGTPLLSSYRLMALHVYLAYLHHISSIWLKHIRVRGYVMVFNATFNNMSVVYRWRLVLLVEEIG